MWKNAVFIVTTVFLIVLALTTTNYSTGKASNIPEDKQEQKPVKDTSWIGKVAKQYNEFVDTTLQQENSPGAAVVIIKGDRIVLIKGYGVRKAFTHDSVNIHTVFRLGSVSKGFASVLTGILVQDSILHWNDRVLKYLPKLPLKDTLNSRDMRICHVLSHTTGLPMHTFTNLLDDDVPYGDIVGQLDQVNMIAPPGTVYSYQNVIFSTIAGIVEAATGKSYKKLVKQRIFKPAGMKDASLSYEAMKDNDNVAFPHVRYGGEWKPIPLNDRYYSVLPAAGVNASISDMADWLKVLLGEKPDVISDSTLQTIYKPFIRTPIKARYRRHWKNHLDKLYYGMGWRIFEYDGHKIVYHGGYVKGYRAEIGFDPENKVGICVLFNSTVGLTNNCVPAFFDMYYNHPKNSYSNTDLEDFNPDSIEYFE
jgi:beta-lactamase class C